MRVNKDVVSAVGILTLVSAAQMYLLVKRGLLSVFARGV